MSRPDSLILEQAMSLVHSWEAATLQRLLTTSEAGSAIEAIARELQMALDGDDACRNRDFRRTAYGSLDELARALATVGQRRCPAALAHSSSSSDDMFFPSQDGDAEENV